MTDPWIGGYLVALMLVLMKFRMTAGTKGRGDITKSPKTIAAAPFSPPILIVLRLALVVSTVMEPCLPIAILIASNTMIISAKMP